MGKRDANRGKVNGSEENHRPCRSKTWWGEFLVLPQIHGVYLSKYFILQVEALKGSWL